MELQDRSSSEITEAEKVEFLQLIRQGLDRAEAARSLGYVGRHFRAICSPKSPFYDEDFAHEYGQAISSLEYETNRLERLRSEAVRRAMLDSDRLLEKLLMVYDPDWQVLREKSLNVSGEVVIRQYFKELPTERLQQILEWYEQAEIVEGEAHELPPAGSDDIEQAA